MVGNPAAEGAATQDRVQVAERRLFRRIMMITLPLFLAVAVFLPNLGPLFCTFNSPSTSMAPTFPKGSLHVVSRLSYGYSKHSFDWFDLPITGRWLEHKPARGDIVVFRTPKDLQTFYIKRLIGLPGDRVQIAKGRLMINGAEVAREPAKKNLLHPLDRKLEVPTYVETLPEGVSYQIIETDGDTGGFDNTGEFHVPAAHYFFLGDNRDNSNDSRVPITIGYVPSELLLGRVEFTFTGDETDEDSE